MAQAIGAVQNLENRDKGRASGSSSTWHTRHISRALAQRATPDTPVTVVRARLSPQTFRLWFFAGLLALGAYLAARGLI